METNFDDGAYEQKRQTGNFANNIINDLTKVNAISKHFDDRVN